MPQSDRTPHPATWPSVAADSATSLMYALTQHEHTLAQAMIDAMSHDELSTIRHHCEEIANMISVRFEQQAQEGA